MRRLSILNAICTGFIAVVTVVVIAASLATKREATGRERAV